MLANNIRYCCIVCVGRYLVLRELVLCRQRMPDCNCIFECGHGRHFVLVRQRLRWWPQSDAAMPVQAPTQCLCHWHILRLFERTMPSVYITIMGLDSTYANYGQQCAPHDADICEKVFPGADHGMWCCTSWCWVSSKCARGYPSTLWPGRYWSSSKCDLNAEAISACKYDSSCECRGQLPAGSFGSSSKLCSRLWEHVFGLGQCGLQGRLGKRCGQRLEQFCGSRSLTKLKIEFHRKQSW